MPIREYECEACGYRFERIEYGTDYELPECPRCVEEWGCKGDMRKLPSASSFQLKGEGWTRPSTYTAPKRATDK